MPARRRTPSRRTRGHSGPTYRRNRSTPLLLGGLLRRALPRGRGLALRLFRDGWRRLPGDVRLVRLDRDRPVAGGTLLRRSLVLDSGLVLEHSVGRDLGGVELLPPVALVARVPAELRHRRGGLLRTRCTRARRRRVAAPLAERLIQEDRPGRCCVQRRHLALHGDADDLVAAFEHQTPDALAFAADDDRRRPPVIDLVVEHLAGLVRADDPDALLLQ